MLILDPGWKKFKAGSRDEKKSYPGSGISILDQQHCFQHFIVYTKKHPDQWIQIRIKEGKNDTQK